MQLSPFFSLSKMLHVFEVFDSWHCLVAHHFYRPSFSKIWVQAYSYCSKHRLLVVLGDCVHVFKNGISSTNGCGYSSRPPAMSPPSFRLNLSFHGIESPPLQSRRKVILSLSVQKSIVLGSLNFEGSKSFYRQNSQRSLAYFSPSCALCLQSLFVCVDTFFAKVK